MSTLGTFSRVAPLFTTKPLRAATAIPVFYIKEMLGLPNLYWYLLYLQSWQQELQSTKDKESLHGQIVPRAISIVEKSLV